MSSWSFIAQRATTGDFLDWDLPLDLSGLEWQLSGPGSLKATIAPDIGGLRASDGRLLLEEWGTLLHAENGGLIRWSGILISSSFNDDVWTLEAAGYGTYPHAVSYAGDYSRINVDPAEVIRHIWEHVQSFPDGNLGVRVVGATDTLTRMGTPAQFGVPSDRLKAARFILERLDNRATITDPVLIFDDLTWRGCPAEVSNNNDFFLDEAPDGLHAQDNPGGFATWLRGWIADNDDDVKDIEADPYVLHWADAPNCGEEIDSLAKLSPLDWVERHYWTPDHESIVHEVELHYPRAGRRRDDIVFAQGDNVTSVVTVESNGDEFANTIVGLGAGEGRAMVRRETSVRDGRLRRVHVVADKSITDIARLDALIAEELNARRAAVRVEAVDVVDHPNAPLGSWQLGDDVLIRAELPWLGEIEVWCRVVGWTLTGDTTASLSLVRSDLYRYGGVSPDPA